MLVGNQVSLFLLQLWEIEYMIEVSIYFDSPSMQGSPFPSCVVEVLMLQTHDKIKIV
jgi:hypothetical protein